MKNARVRAVAMLAGLATLLLSSGANFRWK